MRQVMKSAAMPTSAAKNLPAPVGGWNARDPIADMPAKDAVFLNNFFPRTSDVMLRPGSALVATIPADVELDSPHNIRSLLSYKAANGVAKLFAGADDGIYDITAGGTIAAISSAATNAEWQSVNISTAGGSFLWCCNGVDKSRYYNGAAWTVLDDVSTPALTGVTSANITNVSLFKSRLFFTVKNSLSFWYLPVNSVAGAALEFPLGALFRRGGYLVATDAWTLDGGNGPEDYFAAVTSEGEVAVYTGTDPSSASAWSLKGIYYIGKPMSKRCLVKVGGDLCLLTVQGLYPLSKALQSATVDRRSAISDKISRAWVDYTQNFVGLYGWQPVMFPEATMLLVNVPVLSRHDINSVYSYQFVMNTQTGAWTRFVGMPAEVWAVHDGKLYFALHNKVYQAWTGTDDVGRPIDATAKSAFVYPTKGAMNHVKLVRPIVTTNASLKLKVGVDTDYYESESITGSFITYVQFQSRWDQSKWDEAYWSSGASTVAKWRSVFHKPGYALAVRLRVMTKGINMTWIATDLIIQRGGML